MKKLFDRNMKCHAWIAIFAILVQALLPSMVYATGQKDAPRAHCAAMRMQAMLLEAAVQAQADAQTPDPMESGAQAAPDAKKSAAKQLRASLAAGQYCPYCALVHLFALPALGVDFDFATSAVAASATFDPPSALPADFLTAKSRGPPTFS